MRKNVALFFIFVVTALALIGGPAAADRNSRRTPIVTAIEKASPAVVNISTEQTVRESFNPFGDFNHDFFSNQFDDFFKDFNDTFPSRDVTRQTLGSGVIIDNGFVLTNQHVVMQASKITVTLPDHREFAATVVGADPNIDLAVLKIDVKEQLPAALMGKSEDAMIGETVIAIGNPFGLEHTITVGVLSAKNRSIKGDDGKVYNNFLQTDASINPGNSGGPLVNLDGEVVGINTAIYAQAQGIGFAIPIDRTRGVITDLIKYGSVQQAWVGLRVQDLTPDLARAFKYTGVYGVLVADVLEDSPATGAGIERGDIIVEANDFPLHSAEEFYDKLTGILAGETARLKVFRDGKTFPLGIKAQAMPDDAAQSVAGQWLGIKVENITTDLAHTFHLFSGEGVVITDVTRDGVAWKTGLRPGDVIHQLGAMKITSIEDFYKAALAASERSSVVIMIQRGRNMYYTNIGPPE